MIKYVCAFALLLFFATPIFASENNATESTLSNGLRLIVLPDHQAPVVYAQVWYRVGSADEVMGKTGLAHMLEHMMFTGTEKNPGQTFTQVLAAGGADNNAQTGFDTTMYYEKFSPEQLPLVLALEADRMQHLKITSENFEKEHHAVEQELAMRVLSHPLMSLLRQLYGVAFVSTPYDHFPIGWDSDVAQLTTQDVKAFYDQWYAPNNVTLVIAGDVDPVTVQKLVSTDFGLILPKPRPEEKKYPVLPISGEKTVDVQNPQANEPQLILNFNVPNIITLQPADQWKAYALDVLSTILNSQLQKQLVRSNPPKASAAQADYSILNRFNAGFMITSEPVALQGFWSSVESSALYAWFETLTQKTAISSDKIRLAHLKSQELALLKTLQNTPVTADELSRARAQTKAVFIYAKDSLNERATFLGRVAVLGLPLNFEELYLKGIDAVTAEQVQAVAKDYFSDNHLTVGLLEPKK